MPDLSIVDLAEPVTFPFGPKSLAQLATCDPKLQLLFHEVSRYRNCTVIIGHRGKAAQDEAFRTGHSKLKWPSGEHNSLPSKAVDAGPYPLDWKATSDFYYFGGFVMGIAAKLGIKLRFGGDWSGDGRTRDQTFNDLVHFELA